MSEQRPVPPDPAADGAAALRRTGAVPLRAGDPARVGPYVPLALLGSGGMGRVYLARPVDDRPGLVAVKVIRPEYAEDPRFRRRFEREASVHARLRTPHTPGLCGTGFRDELLWMATEYLPGIDLAQAVRADGALEPGAVWRLTAQLAQALADLSAAGIVHRDLKPSNVLLSVRGAHVIDFGISKAADASSITGTGNRVGTPAYMSPEHLRTGRSDTASDVFALAGTLVYAATGRAPFGDGTGVDVMHRVAFEEPDPELLGGITAADGTLGALLSACLAKEPERRPAPRDLVEAAAAHSTTPDWPGPLRARVLDRQRAYEVLYRLPVRGARAALTGARADASAPAPAAGPPVATAVPSAGAGPDRSRPPAARLRARKPVPAAAAVAALCAVTAGILVAARPDAPATAHSPATGPTASVRSVPGATASLPAPRAPGGTSAEDPSGGAAHADGAAGHSSDLVTSAPTSSPAAADDDAGRDGPSAPTTGSGASAGAGASPDGPSSAPATPPWISECTYYSGNGRTRRGDSGKRVSQVQCMLTHRGRPVGDGGVDGLFGSGTEAAVRSFQGARGLAADGVVGRETWEALRDTE